MTDLKYRCMKCGTCCHEVPGNIEYPTYKRIPLYPDEAEILIKIAKERAVPFKVIEDLVFPDKKNNKIIVVTYRIRLDNEHKRCPFYSESTGCTVHEYKPLACKAYPLALKQIDAFNSKIDIDPLCNFVINNYEELENSDSKLIQQIFEIEYKNAMEHLKKNKKIMLKLKELEYLNKIDIYRKIKLEDFNRFLKEWDRTELIV